MKVSFILPAAISMLIFAGTSAVAATPATQPTAAELIREVQQSELWFDQLTSFRLRAESHWTKTPAYLESLRSERHKQFPSREPTTQNYPDLAAESKGNFELAAAPNRLRLEDSEPSLYELALWDGKQQIGNTRLPNGRDQYSIGGTPYVASSFLSNIRWGKTARHHYWWTSEEEARYTGDDIIPEDYILAGQTNYRGDDCYILESTLGTDITLYIGVTDHRLHGRMTRCYSSKSTNPNDIDNAMLDALRKHFGNAFPTWDAAKDFKKTLPKERIREVQQIQFSAVRPFRKPFIEEWMSDYREVAPGRFFPMTQGYSFYNLDTPDNYLKSSRDIRITTLELNPKLDNALFTADIKEGADVYDAIRKLSYKQKKDRTPAEWKKMLDEAAAQKAEMDAFTNAQKALIGTPAPAFPKDAQWLNSPTPLSWTDLKGKVVLIDFFADWCGPCRNDLPVLANLHKQSRETGITILAIHPPGSKRESIDKVLKDFDLTYPICIDIPDPADTAWGAIYAQYHVNAIPHTFVVDRDGRIAAHGGLAETLPVARRLAAK